MYIMYTAYMNIDAAFSVSFPEAARRHGRARWKSRTATERDARGKEGLCEAERSESHANGEREGDARVRARETESDGGDEREREKERRGLPAHTG